MLTSIFNFLDPQDKLGSLWCSFTHQAPMWPIHGRYECRTCGRLHRVPWADAKPSRRVSASIAEFGPRSLAGQVGD
jgi:hypothetical protein